MNRKQLLKDAAIAVSLANLCFIPQWSELLGSSADRRHMFIVYSTNNYVASIISVLLLGAGFFTAISVVRKWGNEGAKKIAQWIFLILAIVSSAGFVRSQFPKLSLLSAYNLLDLGYFNKTEMLVIGVSAVIIAGLTMVPRRRVLVSLAAATAVLTVGRSELSIIAIVPVVMSALILIRWQKPITLGVAMVIIILTPFVALTFGDSFVALAKLGPKNRTHPLGNTHNPSTRIVWIVFDEMDQKTAFESDPSIVYLPEHARLRTESLCASNAFPPANYTLMSMPALITGRMITQARPDGPSELMLTYDNSVAEVAWSAEPNVFTKARDAGINTALIGWYHPYCRIIGSSLSECSCQDLGERSIQEAVLRQFKGLGDSVPAFGGFRLFDSTKRDLQDRRLKHRDEYLNILREAKIAAADSTVGLVLAHFPVPHMPGIYDRHKDMFELNGESSYVDNLYLADKALGELRSSMESAGVWDRTVVLVTADHWWRADLWKEKGLSFQHSWTREDDAVFSGEVDRRVPFLLRMPGESKTMTYEPAFNTVVTGDLFLALLNHELTSGPDVARWLDQHLTNDYQPRDYKVP